ncbi:MAG: Nramp family divalent metal transporter [Patescibacteria group bacterium]
MKLRLRKLFKDLGPGIITGAADDDPSGIATYSQAGAMFGHKFLWTSLYILPLVYAIQEIAARVGLVTGKGIARNLKEIYPKPLVYLLISGLLIANTINLGVDLGAIATALQLILPVHFDILLVSITIMIVILELFTSYKQYAKVLKWLALSLLAYIITGLFIKADWQQLLQQTLIPNFENSYIWFFTLVGLMGTTISPYVMFWQANEEVEEEMSAGLLSRKGGLPRISWKLIRKMRIDTLVGMLFAAITSWFIMFTAGSTLYPNGITEITSAAQAAEALEPLVQTFPNAGFLAKLLFTFGIVGTGLLAVPIFAASSSYALSELFNWKEGLNNKVKRAKPFYAVIVISTLVGVGINYLGINSIQALVYSAVLNGVVSIPLIAGVLSIGRNERLMGEYRTPAILQALGIFTFICMLAGSLFLLVSSLN